MAQALDPAAGSAHARVPKRLLALRGERHLLARLRVGDEAAFEVLYDRYSAPLLSFCRHMLGRPEEAEDAVQQVFASAHADLQRNQRELELKPWLYAIARNRCLSMLRARREHPNAELEPSTAGLQEQVQARADLRQLVADLGDLPENQRAALLLTELEDLSHAEAATVLDCETSQVKGLVFRAREGLIVRRDARSAACEDIRAELATARRGALRRGRLRHHLAHCPGCSEYLEQVRRQRRMMALILPVIPATGLKRTVLATVGIGTGAGGAGGLSVVGGSVLTGTAAKVAAVAVLAGGAGVATERVVERQQSTPAAAPGAARQTPTAGAPPAAAAAEPARAAPVPPKTKQTSSRERSDDAPSRRSRSRGKSRNNRGASPPGQVRRQSATQPPGQLKKQSATGRSAPARGAPSPSPRAEPMATKPARPVTPVKPAKPQKQKPAKP